MPEEGAKEFSNLAKRLKELGADISEVVSAAVLKFGCLPLAENLIPDDAEFPVTERDKIELEKTRWTPPKGLSKSIFDALSKHPNVFESEILEEPNSAEEALTFATPFHIIVHGPLCSYQVHLPKGQQVYQDMDANEHFSVLSSGSIFAAYLEIPDIPVWPNAGHEFREIARKQIAAQTTLKAPNIGPCPIHPAVYVVVVRSSGTRAATSPQYFEFEEDIYAVFEESNCAEIEEAILDVFVDCKFEVQSFYELMIRRNSVIDYFQEITNRFNEVGATVTSLNDTAAWKIWTSRSLAKNARESLAQVHLAMVRFGTELSHFESSLAIFNREIQSSRLLSNLKTYFAQMANPGVALPSSLTTALSFFEGELQLHGNIRSILTASVIGALLGSILTGLLGMLRHL